MSIRLIFFAFDPFVETWIYNGLSTSKTQALNNSVTLDLRWTIPGGYECPDIQFKKISMGGETFLVKAGRNSSDRRYSYGSITGR
jgi:hypothetical protein